MAGPCCSDGAAKRSSLRRVTPTTTALMATAVPIFTRRSLASPPAMPAPPLSSGPPPTHARAALSAATPPNSAIRRPVPEIPYFLVPHRTVSRAASPLWRHSLLAGSQSDDWRRGRSSCGCSALVYSRCRPCFSTHVKHRRRPILTCISRF